MRADMPLKTRRPRKTKTRRPRKTTASPSTDTPSKTEVALDAFFEIAEKWQLKDKEAVALLGISDSSFYEWQKGKYPAQLAKAKMERVSYVLGIYKALQILFTSKDKADAWVKKPNKAPLFGSRSALEYMMGGNVSDLYNVRRYLDAQLGW